MFALLTKQNSAKKNEMLDEFNCGVFVGISFVFNENNNNNINNNIII